MMDAHIHLEEYPEEEMEQHISEWKARGITGVVAVSKDLQSSRRTLELKRQFPEFVHAAVGFHPEQPLPNRSEIDEILSLIGRERSLISAVGEVGLPYYSLPESRRNGPILERYTELLQTFAEAAVRYDLPLILHAVHDQAANALNVLHRTKTKKAQFHWLKAPPQVIRDICAAGFYISVTPEVCYRERDQALASFVPLNRLMIETDGPWPFTGPFTGISTSPLLLPRVVETIAGLKGIAEQAAVKASRENVLRFLYG